MFQQHGGRRRSGISRLGLAAGVIALALSGCASSTTPSTPAGGASPSAVAPSAVAPSASPAASAAPSAAASGGTYEVTSRPEIADVSPAQPIKIAIIGFSNNPYWVSVKAGADGANKALESHNAQVDWIVAGNTQNVPTVNAAVTAAASQGYQGVGFFIAGDGNCAVIQQLTSQGKALGVYNTLVPCVESSGGVIDYAQEQYQAGMNSAKKLLEALGPDAKGEVGIITSQFTAPGAELRRNGFIDGLKDSQVTPVNKGVEAHDSAGETFTIAQQFIQAAPDLVAIYATAGGPFGAAQAVGAAKKEAQIKVIGYDVTPENVEAIKNGTMFGVTGQDAYGQGYNVAVTLFNKLAANESPPAVMQAAFSPFVTKDNLSEYDPSTHDISTLGGS